jgi:two-component system, response regulator RegA
MEVWETGDAEVVPGLVERLLPKLVILEPSLPGATWYTTLHSVARVAKRCRIVVLTAFPSNALAGEAEDLGVQVLRKPIDNDVLVRAVREPEVHGDCLSVAERRGSLARAEWEYMNDALRACRGNVSSAARQLNIPRQTLYRKLQRYPPRW